MASKLVKVNVLKSVQSRCYSAQAAVKPASDYGALPRESLKTTSLTSGVQVASVETQSPLSRVTIAIRAGSRYEASKNRGVTHLLRLAAGLSNSENTAFGLTRQLQQLGSSLTCTVDREVLTYSVDVTRNHLDVVLKLLANATTKQVFKPWEIKDNIARASLDLKLTPPEVLLLEDLHLAAFRQSDLGQSVLAAPHALSSLGPDQLAAHLAQTLLSRRVAVVGTGVDHEHLAEYAQSLQLPAGDGAAPAGKYWGGEVRAETGGRVALVAVAAEGAGRSAAGPSAVQAVLQAVLGAGPAVKYGGSRGLLGVAAVQTGAAAAGLDAVYSDISLIGYTVVAEADQAGKAVEAVHKVFKSAVLTAEDVNRGKAIAKAAILRAEDDSGWCVEQMALQAATLGSVTSAADAVKAVDAVKLSEVQTLHKKLAGGKLSMAARGNLQHVPYLDQL